MKAPTYRHTLGMPKAAPGQALTAVANPSKVAMAAEAYGALGGTIQQEGLRWFQHLLGKERATKQAAAESGFETTVQNTIVNAKTLGVDTWETSTAPSAPPGSIGEAADRQREGVLVAQPQGASERRTFVRDALYTEAQRQALAITDPVVRTRFLTAASKRISSAMPQISTDLYAKYKDYSLAVHENTSNKYERAIAFHEEHDPIGEALWKDYTDRIRYLGAEGLWSAEKIEKKINDSRGRITSYRVSRALRATETVAQVEEFLDSLASGERWLHLTPTAAARFETQAERRATRLQNKEIAEKAGAVREEERVRKEKQREAGYDALARITQNRILAARGQLPDDPLTVEDLYMSEAGTYTPEMLDRLVAEIQGEKVIHDPVLQAELQMEIHDAFTEQDLADAEDKIHDLFVSGGIGGKAHGDLRTSIQSMRDQTPAALDRKMYAGLVNKVLSKAGVPTVIVGGPAGKMMKQDPRIPAGEGQKKFHNLVDGGMRPAEAYYQVVRRYVEDQEEVVVAVARGMDDQIRAAFQLVSPAQTIDPAKITPEQLATAWDVWEGYARGRLEQIGAKAVVGAEVERGVTRRGMLTQPEVLATGITREQRIGVRALYASESALEYLQDYLDFREVVPDLGPGDNEPDDADGSKTREKDWNWVQRQAAKVFGIGDEDKSGDKF